MKLLSHRELILVPFGIQLIFLSDCYAPSWIAKVTAWLMIVGGLAFMLLEKHEGIRQLLGLLIFACACVFLFLPVTDTYPSIWYQRKYVYIIIVTGISLQYLFKMRPRALFASTAKNSPLWLLCKIGIVWIIGVSFAAIYSLLEIDKNANTTMESYGFSSMDLLVMIVIISLYIVGLLRHLKRAASQHP